MKVFSAQCVRQILMDANNKFAINILVQWLSLNWWIITSSLKVNFEALAFWPVGRMQPAVPGFLCFGFIGKNMIMKQYILKHF